MAQTRFNTYITASTELTLGGRVRKSGDKFLSSELTEEIFQLALASAITGATVSAEQTSLDNFKNVVPAVTIMYNTATGAAVTLPGDASGAEALGRFSSKVAMVPPDTDSTNNAFDNKKNRSTVKKERVRLDPITVVGGPANTEPTTRPV